jgi:hypothetical protein
MGDDTLKRQRLEMSKMSDAAQGLPMPPQSKAKTASPNWEQFDPVILSCWRIAITPVC